MSQNRPDTEETAVGCKIHVNQQVVTVVGERHAPADIKRKAIEQNVSIEMDCVLSIEEEPGKTRIIEEEEVIAVVEGTCFIAASKFEIIVNARPHTVIGRRITFEQVVELAFPDYQPNPNVVFSMTYRHAASNPHAGELGPRGVVEVEDGTVFNVTRTDKS